MGAVTRRAWTLSAAAPALAIAGIGRRGLPRAELLQAPPIAAALPQESATASQRNLAQSPLRGSRVGQVRWAGHLLRQASPTTCGAMSLLVLAALGDPVLALWLTSGKRAGSVPPPELARLSREELALETVAERVAVAERHVHAAARHHSMLPWGSVPVDWPAAVGTPPWGAARAARFRGVAYTHAVVHDVDVARTRSILETVRAANRLGIPVPLYSGGDLGRGGSPATAIPRHVVLAVPSRTAKPGELRIFEPGSGRIYGVGIDALLARRRPHAALGGWRHVVWAVLPAAAYGR